MRPGRLAFVISRSEVRLLFAAPDPDGPAEPAGPCHFWRAGPALDGAPAHRKVIAIPSEGNSMPSIDSARVAIVGLGYVGLPLAVAFARHFHTVGLDRKSTRLNSSHVKTSYA